MRNPRNSLILVDEFNVNPTIHIEWSNLLKYHAIFSVVDLVLEKSACKFFNIF